MPAVCVGRSGGSDSEVSGNAATRDNSRMCIEQLVYVDQLADKSCQCDGIFIFVNVIAVGEV